MKKVQVFGPGCATCEGLAADVNAIVAEEGLEWTKENLDAYLESPRKFIPRGKMAFAGLRKKDERDNVIAYLEEAGKK